MPNKATVRYGLMKSVDTFWCDIDNLDVKSTLIVKTARGIEVGILLSPLVATDEKLREDGLQVLRKANSKDLQINEDMKKKLKGDEVAFCRKRVKELKLPMKVVDVEHLFGSGRIVFYFSADGRVDFRALVKDLAGEYKTRIEMKQIGIRDEARILGENGICGRELCCKSHIKEFDPIGMKMAKLQKDSLDPVKVSGRCGRLMCCLRFEYETYKVLQKELPRRGKRIVTNEGRGEVLNINLISGEMLVRLDDKRMVNAYFKDLPKDQSDKPAAAPRQNNPRTKDQRDSRRPQKEYRGKRNNAGGNNASKNNTAASEKQNSAPSDPKKNNTNGPKKGPHKNRSRRRPPNKTKGPAGEQS